MSATTTHKSVVRSGVFGAAFGIGKRLLGAAVLLPLRGYQKLISPALAPRCKYHPTCSQYAVDAVSQFGVLRGTLLAVWRLLRCNPFSNGGVDPVEDQRLFARCSDHRGAVN